MLDATVHRSCEIPRCRRADHGGRLRESTRFVTGAVARISQQPAPRKPVLSAWSTPLEPITRPLYVTTLFGRCLPEVLADAAVRSRDLKEHPLARSKLKVVRSSYERDRSTAQQPAAVRDGMRVVRTMPQTAPLSRTADHLVVVGCQEKLQFVRAAREAGDDRRIEV